MREVLLYSQVNTKISCLKNIIKGRSFTTATYYDKVNARLEYSHFFDSWIPYYSRAL